MCCSRTRPYPVAEVVERDIIHEEMPVLEPQNVEIEEVVNEEVDPGLELQLLRSIEDAARENQRLIQTVRHFQEIIEEQTELLEQHLQDQMGRDMNNNENDMDEEVDVVTVDDEGFAVALEIPKQKQDPAP